MKKLLIWDFPDDFTPPEYVATYDFPSKKCIKCPFLYVDIGYCDPDEYQYGYGDDEDVPYEVMTYREYFCECDIANGAGRVHETELCPLYNLFYE